MHLGGHNSDGAYIGKLENGQTYFKNFNAYKHIGVVFPMLLQYANMLRRKIQQRRYDI